MYDPLFRLCLLRTQNRLAYQYLLVEGQGAKATTLVLWVGPHHSSHSRRLRVVFDCPGARRVRGPHASRRRLPPVEVFGIPGRDHVGRKEIHLPDVRRKFGGDHSQRGRFQGGGNGTLESAREGREQEAHHEDRERAVCAESEAVVRSESETERDNLADHRGSQLVDDLLPTHNRIYSPVAFVSNRERDNSSDRAILLGDSP